MLKRAIQTAALVVAILLSSHTSFAQDSGADLFKAKCEMCHGADGLGANQMGKALGVVSYNSPDVKKMSDADLTAIIKNGKNSKMPAFNGQLTDVQIKSVLKFIHTLQK